MEKKTVAADVEKWELKLRDKYGIPFAFDKKKYIFNNIKHLC